jgi:hypothetical protein
MTAASSRRKPRKSWKIKPENFLSSLEPEGGKFFDSIHLDLCACIRPAGIDFYQFPYLQNGSGGINGSK